MNSKVTNNTLSKSLFGIKYQINSKGVSASSFTPSLIHEENAYYENQISSTSNFSQYQVYLVEPFYLPLHSPKLSLYDKLAFNLPKLKNDEIINMIWIFQKRNNWRDVAISMYESYLNGSDYPSDIQIVRKLSDRLHEALQNVIPQLERREYSEDVENKILDDGYSFQCTVEIISKRSHMLAERIQHTFTHYDYYNGLRLNLQSYTNPYILQSTNQILSRTEILSLIPQNPNEVEINTTANQVDESEKQVSHKGSAWIEKIELLPRIKNNEIKRDEKIVSRLAESLKRVGVINQARLYNESVQYGSRLTTINADIPKGKNFSDVERKRKDIQAALGVHSLSIEQGGQPGSIKYSIPHSDTQIISLREVIERDDFQEYSKKNDLAFIVGFDEINNPIYLSLKELRHILVVGSQGSGKSVFVNQLLTTLLITHNPEELNLLLIDPKQVELEQYRNFPHVQDVITNMQRAMKSFNDLIKEMESRYELFAENNVKDIWGYRQKTGKSLPYLITVIEEWADLYSVVGKDAESIVLRLGQKARAAGMFLIIITQRPSANILSGDIKANIQSKFSFNLGSNTNYKTVFDTGIPYSLLGKGDGVFSVEGHHKEFQRFQSPIITLNGTNEFKIYEDLSKTYESDSPQSTDIDTLDKLKQLIATKNETRVTVLRDELGVKSTTVTELMNQLVKEGWPRRHRSRAKGYELIADNSELERWRDVE